MENKFLCLLRYLSKINRDFIYLFFFVCNLAVAPAFGGEYIKCNDINVIESFASSDYVLEKSKEGRIVTNGKTTNEIQQVNSQYINYINFPYNANNIDYLFQPLRISKAKETIEGAFLTCGLEVGDILCDSESLIDKDGITCQKEFNIKNGEEIKSVLISDCETYDNYASRDKSVAGNNISNKNDSTKLIDKACYPENHICNKYKEGTLNKYYSVVKKQSTANATNDEFYIFEKTVVKEKVNKNGREFKQNCNFEVFLCDYKIKNELNDNKGYVNVVLNTTNNTNNKKFVDNILGNLGDYTFFINPDKTKTNRFKLSDVEKNGCGISKYNTETNRYRSCNVECNKKTEGTTEYSDCKTKCENDYNNNYKIPCEYDFIMRSSYYFKYMINIEDNEEVYYFAKNINFATFGEICNGYLPNCKYIYPSESLNALYNNTVTKDGGNNVTSRDAFYSGNKDVREEYLWYVGEQNISYKKCLSIVSDSDKISDYDVGYCSDLNDNGDGLKYPDGLVNGYIEATDCNASGANKDEDCIEAGENKKKFRFKAPNCYLKSCIDLSNEELEKILSTGKKNAKYCSEYYWLEDQYGMKYFPKEKPVYCSDLENVYIWDNNGNISVVSETDYAIKDKKIISTLKFRDKDFKIKRHDYYDKEKRCELKAIKKPDEVMQVPREGDDKTEPITIEGTEVYDYDCSGVEPEKRYYSYGGGINSRKSNCYLKSCFSMTAEERIRVANANMLNISRELERTKEEGIKIANECNIRIEETSTAYDNCMKELPKYNNYISCLSSNEGKSPEEQKDCSINDYKYDSALLDCDSNGCNCRLKLADSEEAKKCSQESYSKKQIDLNFFKSENLPVYCNDTFMLSSRFDKDFNDLNLNVIPCYEFNKVLSGSYVLNSNNLITNYNTNNSYVLCRNNFSSSFNSETVYNDILKDEEGSVLNSLFSYSEENNDPLKSSYRNNSLIRDFNESEYYIKIKYDSSNYDETVDKLNIESYRGVCQNLDNNILYYNARIPGIDSNGGLGIDYFESSLIQNLNSLSSGSGDTNNEREMFLEKYVYKCENYKSKYNKIATFMIDCGLYHDFDENKEVNSLGNDIISTMDNDVKNFLKIICVNEIEMRKPDEREVLSDVVDARGSVRSDKYNWLLKPIPLSDYNSINKDKYIARKITSFFKKTPSSTLKESYGCTYYENYNDVEVNKVVETRIADAIPMNKTNYISTTNFSDPVRKRSKGEKCDDNQAEANCKNGVIIENTIATSLYNDMSKCQVGLDSRGEPKFDTCKITVCVRYPSDVRMYGYCGVREDSVFRDKCLEIPINGDIDERTVPLSLIGGSTQLQSPFLGLFKNPDRLRTKKIGDKIFVFRDAIVDYKSNSNVAGTPHFEDKLEKKCNGGLCIEKDFKFDCGDKNASKDYWEEANAIGLEDALYNIRNKEFIYFDAEQYYQRHIAAKGTTYGIFGAGYIAGCGITATGCGLAHLFDSDEPSYDQCFHTCVSEALFQTTDLTVKKYRNEFIYYMNSSRNHILDYFNIDKLPSSLRSINDSGLIIAGNIIDNNNYLYMYYPRYDTIERDIRSKMESNIDKNGNRFYHNTVLAKDIIRACKLERFVGDKNTDKLNSSGRRHIAGEINFYESGTYEFVYYRLDKDGNQLGLCNEKDIENCLDPEILRCLESYDVSFIKHTEASDGIIDSFVMRNGKHLKQYLDCGNLVDVCSSKGGLYNEYIPTNIVAYTGNKYSNNELKNRDDCKLDEYGKPLGDLSRCRGFEDDTNGNNLFYTETQSVPVPLYTHPFFFYTLITPRNTPELFNPTFILSQYYKFSDYNYNQNGKPFGRPRDIEKINDIIVDFFNPAFKFNYDFVNGTNNSDYENKFGKTENNFISEIEVGNKRSYPYVVQYSSNIIPTTAPFKYILDKSYDIDKKGCYTPKVCVYEVAVVSKENNEANGLCASNIPGYVSGIKGVIKIENGECIKIVDNGVGCYDRNIPYLDKFILKLDENSFIYNTPYINVFLRPNDPSKDYYEYIVNDAREDYIMLENDINNIIEIDSSFEKTPVGDRVAKRAYSEKQGFGLNFERSYCSQMYFDYYTSLDTLQREEASRDKKDYALINRLKTVISTINTTIKPECDGENGEEGEYIIEEGTSLKDLYDEEREKCKMNCTTNIKECEEECNNKKITGDYSSRIIARKTAVVKRYNESYGGFNEICVADNDISNILKVYKTQNPGTITTKLPDVVVFADNEGRGRKTKCLLNSISRQNPKCLRADKVYVYCKQSEKGIIGHECEKPKLDIRSLKWDYIKEIDCRKYLTSTEITANNIDEIKACYKGGFNYTGNVYTRDGKQDDVCTCTTTSDNQSLPNGYFTKREMTPREYGLCVNLITPEVCPAVRYYDSSSKYTDDNLILGLTREEIKENEDNGLLKYTDYQQHLWRTNEKIAGYMQSVMFTSTLGHAEFDPGIYCDVDDDQIRKFLEESKVTNPSIDVEKILREKGSEYTKFKNEYVIKTDYYNKNCIGGSRTVSGECNGFWNWSAENFDIAPTAICTIQEDVNGNKIYEYTLVGNSCERYSCENVSYDDKTGYAGDEKEIGERFANVFQYSEIDAFKAAPMTDYKTFVNNEEKNTITVDKRGVSHGYASWKKVISSDYASVEVAYDCLTGFSPAGLNYDIKNIGNDEEMVILNNGVRIDANYDTPYIVLDTPNSRNEFIQFIVGQNNRVNVLKNKYKLEEDSTIKAKRYPIRKCNQKGEWMTVEDVYNLSLLDKQELGNNYYYNDYNYKTTTDKSKLNYWLKMFDFDQVLSNKEFNRNTEFNGYCERNVCLAIDPKNENVFDREFTYNNNNKAPNRYYVWKHSGGASWENLGAPRNDSGKIDETSTSSNVSRNIVQIFNEKVNEADINTNKYLKKVQGICRTDYGYYNRFSEFSEVSDKTFKNQLEFLASKFGEELEKSGRKDYAIDQRRSDFGANENSGVKPERVCTSYGVWGPIFNRCFRGCEMLDIFHTNFSKDFSDKIIPNRQYVRGTIFVENKNFYVENNDIASTIIAPFDNSVNGVMDNKFKQLGLDYSPDFFQFEEIDANGNVTLEKGSSIADYVIGGAKWPRTIILENSPIEDDISSNKYGLRYIEVEGDCDSSFNTDDDDRVRSYVNRDVDEAGNIIKPRRKCYEDGSWGQVYGDTRCVLKKNCKTFNFTLYDLMLLMQMYDNVAKYPNYRNDTYDSYLDDNYVNPLLNALNTELTRTIAFGYYSGENNPREKEDLFNRLCNNYKDIRTCTIYGFEASNAVATKSVSYEVNRAYSNGGFKNTGDSSLTKDGKLICNTTTAIGQKITGWNLGVSDIGDYFVPNTCNEGATSDEFYSEKGSVGNSSGDISELIHHKYNTNLVPVIYNVENPNKLSINNSILHYAEESKLHYLYNNLHLNSGKNFTGVSYPKATEIENESEKNVKIGKKSYKSYQMHYRCNEDYFYNLLPNVANGSENGKNIEYYHNDIILECRAVGDNYKIVPNDKADKNKLSPDATKPLHPENCYVRTCGSLDSGITNPYNKHWSLSIPVEFVEKFAGGNAGNGNVNIYNHIRFVGNNRILSTRSYMECPKITREGVVCSGSNCGNDPIETAFILNEDLSKISNYITYYGQDKSSAAEYRTRRFVTKIAADCLNSFRSNTINGITANTLTNGKRSYDIQRFGELDSRNLPYKFCRDLNKKESDCKEFSESQVAGGVIPRPFGSIGSESIIFLNNIKDKGGYCVPMACKGKNLKFEDGKVLECTDVEVSAGKCFSLAKTYYNFEENVVIQNIEGDYPPKQDSSSSSGVYITVDHNGNLFTINDKNSQYNLQRICDADQSANAAVYKSDIYTNSTIQEYNYSNYINEIDDLDEVDKINECFDKLESPDSVSSENLEGYVVVGSASGTNVYAKYKEDNSSIMGVATKLLSGRDSFSLPTDENSKKLENEAIGNSAIIAINNNSSYSNIKKEFITDVVANKLATQAREEANKVDLTANNNTCYCYHASDSAANAVKGVAITTANSTKMTNYKKYSGTNNTFYSATVDSSFVGIKIDGTECETTYAKTVTDNKGVTTTTNVTVKGVKVCDVNVYNSKYESYYNNTTNRQSITATVEAEVKTKIINKESNFVAIYNKHYTIYKMKKFMEKETGTTISYKDDDGNDVTTKETYLDVYNDYLEKTGKSEGYVLSIMDTGEYFLVKQDADTNNTNTTEFSGNVYVYDVDDKNSFICKILTNVLFDKMSDIYKGENIGTNCSNTNDEIKIIQSIYENYFINFFSTDEIKSSINESNKDEQYCKSKYVDFMTKSIKHYGSYGGQKSVQPGLYLAMKCTPDGWEVYGKPSCKKRCNGTSFENTRVNPYNLDLTTEGRHYRFIVEYLRYTKTARALFGGVIRACVSNISGSSSYGELEVKCDDFVDQYGENKGTVLKSRVIATNKGGGIPTWRRFYRFPCFRYSYRTNYSFSDGGRGECYKEWKCSSYEFYHCLGGDNGGLDSGKGPSHGALSENKITRLKAVTLGNSTYDGQCLDSTVKLNNDFFYLMFHSSEYRKNRRLLYKNCTY